MAIRTAYVKKYIHVPPVNIPVSYDFTRWYSSLTKKTWFSSNTPLIHVEWPERWLGWTLLCQCSTLRLGSNRGCLRPSTLQPTAFNSRTLPVPSQNAKHSLGKKGWKICIIQIMCIYIYDLLKFDTSATFQSLYFTLWFFSVVTTPLTE